MTSSQIKECPNCKGTSLSFKIVIEDQISFDLHETLKTDQKIKKNGMKTKRIKTFEGADWCVQRNKFVDKKRIVDEENDHYYEKVMDGEEILRDCDEKLSAHRGHGSAKFKKEGND